MLVSGGFRHHHTSILTTQYCLLSASPHAAATVVTTGTGTGTTVASTSKYYQPTTHYAQEVLVLLLPVYVYYQYQQLVLLLPTATVRTIMSDTTTVLYTKYKWLAGLQLDCCSQYGRRAPQLLVHWYWMVCETSSFCCSDLCYYNTGNYATIEDRARSDDNQIKYEVLGSEYLYLVFLSSAY